jgi:taspase (threonine aspartase 1)
MKILPFDALVSPSAKDRWRRWSQDLRAAERKARDAEAARYGLSPTSSESDPYSSHSPVTQADRNRLHYTAAMSEGLVNDAQPLSPPPSDEPSLTEVYPPKLRASSATSLTKMQDDAGHYTEEEYFDPDGPPQGVIPSSAPPFMNSSQIMAAGRPARHDGGYGTKDGSHAMYASRMDEDIGEAHDASSSYYSEHTPGLESHHDAISLYIPDNDDEMESEFGYADEAPSGRHNPNTAPGLDPHVNSSHDAPRPEYPFNAPSPGPFNSRDDDHITDTVGAIAIDSYGNIACGASSGGIGMKHRGRIGPAALVGIGASVIPVSPEDPDRTTVATVTSGTGEHMGTTLASSTCSDRIFYSRRRTPGGGHEQVMEEEAIKSFIDNDFMGHPSVRNSMSAGAIGVLTVKKTADSAMLFFAHNTNSFALASMSSDDAKPACVMSRNNGHGTVAQGGRMYRIRRKKV